VEVELTLDKAKRFIRQWEAVREQQAEPKTPFKEEETSLNSVEATRQTQPQKIKQVTSERHQKCGKEVLPQTHLSNTTGDMFSLQQERPSKYTLSLHNCLSTTM